MSNFFNAKTDNLRFDFDVLLQESYATRTSDLDSLRPRGRVLFAEGEPARGVYLLRSGSVSVSTSSPDGRVLILRIARAGSLLGLNAVLRGSFHDTTVRTLEPSNTEFISRTRFLNLLDQSKSVNRAVLAIVSKELADLGERAKSLLLSQTASSKLAKLLLQWYLDSDAIEVGHVRIDRKFTHEQMGQMIGSSRETITRLLAAFRKNQIIRTAPNGFLVADLSALERVAFGMREKP